MDSNINENIENSPKKKENKLTSSLLFYKESKIFTKFRRIYKKMQVYISICLLFLSAILFAISLIDLMAQMKKKTIFFYANYLYSFAKYFAQL